MPHQICTQCVMDTTAPEITFDSNGVCTFCYLYNNYTTNLKENNTFPPHELEKKIATMKAESATKKYDCIVGISGGVDSSYICHIIRQWGVRPLLVHADNGWNAELAEYNMQCLVEKTGFDFVRTTLDFEEFRELQKAYFRASVCDVEVLTDHALMATLYRKAEEYNIRTIITGNNYATEFIMPFGWNFDKTDIVNIKSICEKYATVPIKTYPVYGILSKKRHYTTIDPLNYSLFEKNKAVSTLQREYGWKEYPYKHCESNFTYFYQAYYLPVKFGIDKRICHFSDLIHSGQMTRAEAIQKLAQPPYAAPGFEDIKNKVLTTLGFSSKEWQKIMESPPVPHTAFPTTPSVIKDAQKRL